MKALPPLSPYMVRTCPHLMHEELFCYWLFLLLNPFKWISLKTYHLQVRVLQHQLNSFQVQPVMISSFLQYLPFEMDLKRVQLKWGVGLENVKQVKWFGLVRSVLCPWIALDSWTADRTLDGMGSSWGIEEWDSAHFPLTSWASQTQNKHKSFNKDNIVCTSKQEMVLREATSLVNYNH